MQKTIISGLLIFVLLPAFVIAQSGTVQEQSMNSSVLHRPVSYSVYQPDATVFHAPYRLLILLHGLNGDHETFFENGLKDQLDSLHSKRLIAPLIVVTPRGFNSYFINAYNEQMNWEQMLLEELLPHLKQHYPVDVNNIFTGGFSMGGYGAINLLMKYPDQFQGCLAVSAALRTDVNVRDMDIKEYMTKYGNVFGQHHKPESRITDHWKANNFFYQIEQADIRTLQDKSWYISCGDDDYLSSGNALLHTKLKSKHIGHEFRMFNGSHSLDYFFKTFQDGCLMLFKRR
ncbi:MAG: hypothetical protein GVY19_08540 [Bacteroidetes bacterium]|nr:hypothetical protein [Bacteroidota bacterium]